MSSPDSAPKSDSKSGPKSAPQSHHLDKRADQLTASDTGNDDDLLTTKQVADWLGISTQWLEIGRSKNYGPRFVRISARVIRYTRGDVREWLRGRSHASTAEYGGRVTAEKV
jgi:predicted DNA-binding transcriptional regulator AlpA